MQELLWRELSVRKPGAYSVHENSLRRLNQTCLHHGVLEKLLEDQESLQVDSGKYSQISMLILVVLQGR
jgi:hypothetical protein